MSLKVFMSSTSLVAPLMAYFAKKKKSRCLFLSGEQSCTVSELICLHLTCKQLIARVVLYDTKSSRSNNRGLLLEDEVIFHTL